MTLVKVNNPIATSLDGIMKDFFNEFPSKVSKTFREDVLHFPPVNILDKPNAYQLDIAIPGFEKSDFNVKLENNILSISTEKKEVSNESTDKVIRREFSYKAFKRSFTIDEKIDSANISAKYENGILVLTLPKKEISNVGATAINIQ